MAPRALRKLQQQQELLRQVEAAKAAYEAAEDSDDGSEEEEPPVAPSKPRNAFDMLEDAPDDDASDDDDDDKPATHSTHPSSAPDPSADSVSSSLPAPATSKKKKKKKAKKKAKGKEKDPIPVDDESGDEVDRALRALAAKDAASGKVHDASTPDPSLTWESEATKLLAIDGKNLNPVNEMRSLFGSIALEGEARTPPRAQRRREQNLQGGVDLATGLTGRYSVASRGKELGALATRRNVFMQGKEEWPLATSGGLSMELVPATTPAFEKRYNIMHSQLYRETQAQFRMAVESMDPQRMIALLSMHPYHVATLLQVSEIAKHQGDHAVSGDLVERALFSIGRSVHSSFPASLRNGVVRIPFEKPANRELYLTIWRYIRNLEMRGTWKTAFEWAKVLLQLNTLSDPYGITLAIDQYALRGRQHAHLIELCSDEAYGQAWAHLPNIQISLALALHRAAQPRDARAQLAVAMHKYPFILSNLASALDISPLPKSLWAKLPSTDAEKLYSELYVTRAKDLWNTPETISLLGEVAETLGHYSAAIEAAQPAPKLQISLEEARHIMLLEMPPLIALLPRHFTTMPTSSSDVLPPPDSQSDFVARAPTGGTNNGPMQAIFNAAGATAGATGEIVQRIMNWFQTPAGPNDANGESDGQVALRNLQEELGGDVPPEMIEQLLQIHLDDSLGEGEHVTPAGLGMVGGWDYYGEEDQESEGEEGDSMPDLESIPGEEDVEPAAPLVPPTPRNPRAAMVEDDADEEEPRSTRDVGGPSRGILRHVDSDPESDQDDGPSQGATTGTPPSQPAHPLPTPSTEMEGIEETTDPQRIQRWLLTTGLTDLQSTPSTLGRYVQRLQMLRKQQQEWIVNMVKQRAGAEVEARVRRALS